MVLDIGGEVGAAILVAPAPLAAAEIEIRPVSEPWQGRHVAVLERQTSDGPVHAAIFASLNQGDYEVRVRHQPDSPVVSFAITGGRVTTTHWPDP